MIRLFSPFDMSFWFIPVILLSFFLLNITRKVWLESTYISSFSVCTNFVQNLVNSTKPNSINKMFIMLPWSFILTIFLFNFTSVLPYNFSLTSDLGMVLRLSLSIWVRFIIFRIFNNLNGFLSHCIPQGTPILLTWFLFIVEIVRNSIRPITLTVRLVANILAGHLLMILLSNLALGSFCFSSLYLLLNIVEMVVAIIQSYIFVTIISLYYSEVN